MISIKVPVLNAMQDMGIDFAKDTPTFTRWAAAAENQIGSYYSLKKTIKVLTIKGCAAELPCEASTVQRVLLGDFGCECDDLFNRILNISPQVIENNTQQGFIVVNQPSEGTPFSCSLSGIRWEVQGNKLVFNSDRDGEKVTVQYLGLETDDDGFPKVGQNHVDAIVEYIMYRYAIRSRFSPIKMDHMDVRRHKDEWNRLCSHARAEDAELSETDRMQIVAMIHDPYIGYGLEVGMYGRGEFNNGLYQ